MENQIQFTGILSNKAEENPGLSLYLTHACILLLQVQLNSALLEAATCTLISCMCFVIFLHIIFHAQISITGTELN